MSETSNSVLAESTIQGATQPASAILVSRVKNARGTTTTICEAAKIIEEIRTDQRLREQITPIRDEFWRVMAGTNNNRDDAKEAVAEPKKRLEAVTWSGTFGKRTDENLLQHSGLLCADLDGLGPERIAEIRAQLRSSPHLYAEFLSPTGDGDKAVFRVRADGNSHLASYRAVAAHVQKLTGVQIDEKCKNVGRLCFLSADPDAFLNEAATELPPLTESEAPKTVEQLPVSDARLQTRREIAAELLGDITWSSDSSGFCHCPGQHRHNNGNSDRDCEVHLDRVPTIYCFHESCLGIITGVNHELRSQIGKAEPNAKQENITNAEAEPLRLPEIISADQFLGDQMELPAELIDGMIHRGTLNMLAGGSKSCKSFTLLDLGISVSQGVKWWERDVEKGRVLYVNFEISEPFLQRRIFELAEAKGLDEDPSRSLPDFDVWNLRGYAADVDQLMPLIIARCRDKDYSMIILDPIYKLIGGRDENSAGDMAHVLNQFDKLARETGAAIVYSHHFAKGLAGKKDQLDRASGSGVFARHADAIITITPHQEDGAVVVEATLRNMRAPKPFCMRWQFPLMRLDPNLDPTKLKSRAGAKSKYSVADVAACLVNGMTTTEWQTGTVQITGMAPSTFATWKKKVIAKGRVEERDGKWFHRPTIYDPVKDTVVAASEPAMPDSRSRVA